MTRLLWLGLLVGCGDPAPRNYCWDMCPDAYDWDGDDADEAQASLAKMSRHVVTAKARGADFETNDRIFTGMKGRACRFKAAKGISGGQPDYNLSRSFDRVLAVDRIDTEIVVVSGVREQSKSLDFRTVARGTAAATHLDDGLVQLGDTGDGCQLVFDVADGPKARVPLNDLACALPSLTASRENDAVWVADGLIERHTAETSEVVGEGAMAAWDEARQLLYVRTTWPDSVVYAQNDQGEVLWEHDLKHAVQALTTVSWGVAAHQVDLNGQAYLVVLDGDTGERLTRQPILENRVATLRGSPDGNRVAVDTGTQLVVYTFTP